MTTVDERLVPGASLRVRSDWALAFAGKLRALGAPDAYGELVKLGHTLYCHYDLLEAEDIARAAWTRWPARRQPPAA